MRKNSKKENIIMCVCVCVWGGGGVTWNGGIRDFAILKCGIRVSCQNLGRESGFATSGGSGIKSFFMAAKGISRHRRDRDLDYFAIFGGIKNIISSILPFGSLNWPIKTPVHQRNRIQTQTLTQELSFRLFILGSNSTFQ